MTASSQIEDPHFLPFIYWDVGDHSVAVPVGAVGSPQDCLLPNPSTNKPSQ